VLSGARLLPAPSPPEPGSGLGESFARPELIQSCRAVSLRASTTLQWTERQRKPDIRSAALDRLTLGRVALFVAILEQDEAFAPIQDPDQKPTPHSSESGDSGAELDATVASLRLVGQQDYLVCGLLPRAQLNFLRGSRTGPESAQTDLDEAWEIAERGPMSLFVADIHLHRARLFFREKSYPWESPDADLAEARRLIKKHGYWRRKEELEDAEEAINKTSSQS
jgi:hypothetical protein